MKIFTIGFTKKSAEEFFRLLRQPGLARVVDVRLNNASQLAGFTKKKDLEFFLREINGVGYVHLPQLAPTKSILDEYKKHGGDWTVYEKRFMELMESRDIAKKVDRALVDGGCLLCSEATPENCHRRLVAEYLEREWGDVETCHL